jgi:hypothetical protein
MGLQQTITANETIVPNLPEIKTEFRKIKTEAQIVKNELLEFEYCLCEIFKIQKMLTLAGWCYV